MDTKEVYEIATELINEGADKAKIDALIDAVGKLATELAVKNVSKVYNDKIKEAIELASKE